MVDPWEYFSPVFKVSRHDIVIRFDKRTLLRLTAELRECQLHHEGASRSESVKKTVPNFSKHHSGRALWCKDLSEKIKDTLTSLDQSTTEDRS